MVNGLVYVYVYVFFIFFHFSRPNFNQSTRNPRETPEKPYNTKVPYHLVLLEAKQKSTLSGDLVVIIQVSKKPWPPASLVCFTQHSSLYFPKQRRNTPAEVEVVSVLQYNGGTLCYNQVMRIKPRDPYYIQVIRTNSRCLYYNQVVRIESHDREHNNAQPFRP